MRESDKTSESARCALCGCNNSPNLRFCRDCGQRLDPQNPDAPASPPPPGNRCSACGHESPEGARFCVECGSVLTRGTRAETSLIPPPPAPALPCPRCRGTNDPSMGVCQFCGAPLSGVGTVPAAVLTEAQDEPHDAARLVVVTQNGATGRHFELPAEQNDIGREEGSIRLGSDPYVSPRHARILRRTGRFFLQDLSSVNGVYLRIRAVERLQHADLLLIGLEVLRFEVVSDAEQGLGPATERAARVFGSPTVPRYARLSQRTAEGVTRNVFYISRDETVIGRESGDLVFTQDPFMSRRHTALTRDPTTGDFAVRDLDSSNGTYLAIRGEREVRDGDHIRIGQHLFRLEIETHRSSR